MSVVLRISVLALILGVLAAAPAAAVPAEFDKPTNIESNVAFWKRVYGEWRVDDIAFHDEHDLGLVYRVVRVPKRGGKDEAGRTRGEVVAAARAELETALKALQQKQPKKADELSGLEKDVFLSLSSSTRADKYTRLSTIRPQNGLYERFVQGYSNSGLYDQFIGDELERQQLPRELIGIAFVESLFYTGAKSKVGAAGVWQFMSYTGREYMQLNPVVDERWDPILATEAAAKYLKAAKKELGTWPLAVTSYNYGRGGMKQLVKSAGTSDFNTILDVTRGKRFGFAGRNYYASFLAVLEILDEKETRFAGVQKQQPWAYDVVRLPYPLFSSQLLASGVCDQATFEWLNPGLTDEAARGALPLPHGMSVRVPKGQSEIILNHLLGLPDDEKFKASRTAKLVHTANGKQTLKDIAKKHGVPVHELAARTGLTPTAKLAKGDKVAIPPPMPRTSLLPEARALPTPPFVVKPGVLLADAVQLLPKAAPAPKRIVGLNAPSLGLKGAVAVTVSSEVVFTSTLPVVDMVAGASTVLLPECDMLVGAAPPAPADEVEAPVHDRSGTT
jgi:membrane-bound lytic murein transglycosylase D